MLKQAVEGTELHSRCYWHMTYSCGSHVARCLYVPSDGFTTSELCDMEDCDGPAGVVLSHVVLPYLPHVSGSSVSLVAKLGDAR
jgi:hypothetical protein